MGVGICARRRVWGQVGVMDNSLKYAQDYDMWLRILTISPGIFIPERTFTYRHHPGKGSETFQLGCLFDASKSGIRYINNHSFKEFFPFLDLSDEYSAIKALTKSLEVASDPSAYLYSLGPHPAFVLRLLEWLGKQEGSFREKLDGIVKQYSTMVNDKYPGTRFGNIWNNTIALYVDQNPLVYKPVSNLAVALDNYFHCLSVNHPLTAPLMKYLENYEGIRLEGITPQAYYPIRGELLQKYFIEPNFTALLDHAQQAGSEQNNSLISKFASILKGLSK